MKTRLLFYTCLLGVALFIVSAIIGGALIEGYGHMSQFISESYAVDTEYGFQLRWFGFIPSGLLLALFCFFSVRYFQVSNTTRWAFYGISLFYGIATIIVSIFPCDSGCNKELINPSMAQLIHNGVGMLTYLVVPVCILLIGFGLKQESDTRFASQSKFMGILSISFVFTLMSQPDSDLVGLYQRMVELSILVWLVLCAIALRAKNTTT